MIAQRPFVEAVLRTTYPTGLYEDLAVQKLDRLTTEGPSRVLVDQLVRDQHAAADVELPADASERRCVLRVGRPDAPSWTEFMEEMNAPERSALLGRHGELTYWVVDLSRVGPFWTGYWNSFGYREGRMTATLLEAPSGSPWTEIVETSRVVLAEFGFQEVLAELAEEPVHWLTTRYPDHLRIQGRPTTPTIHHALFGDFD